MRAVLISRAGDGGALSKSVDRKLHHLRSNSFYPLTVLANHAFRRCKDFFFFRFQT